MREFVWLKLHVQPHRPVIRNCHAAFDRAASSGQPAHVDRVEPRLESWKANCWPEGGGWGLVLNAPHVVVDHLAHRGILVKTVTEYGLSDCLRITIGREEENKALVIALAEILG